MSEFQYYMPTKVLLGENVVINRSELFTKLGTKAFIITGKSSSKKNGSLEDVTKALNKHNISYCIFDEVEENPSLETVEKASTIGRKEGVDFIIGIGGGSPIDSSKAIGVLVKNKDCSVEDLFSKTKFLSLPIVAVPTTAGTGTEVTPYAIFTDHKLKTKRNFGQQVFPEIALLDAKYLNSTPDNVTINTAVDALSHLIEGYLSANANILSDTFAEKGFVLFSECFEALKNRSFNPEIREKLLLASTIAGVVIAQAGTSLPHGMGYPLTYFNGIPHGRANGLILKAYLELCSIMDKQQKILSILKFNNIDEFGKYIEELIGKETSVTEEQIIEYSKAMISNKDKLKNHPFDVTEEDILNMYKKSLLNNK
ncbi:lactaldehyde reductase [Clostridium homopropionicum DSM 5847]|uniref:Lactaldehyde reductase n=1 Tax=Clostridium homopropionicum DSM 5847 TaxID=1121318 RepID=A0A0L6Z9R4_9CLOT|nr:iron-containing alcohol dehydrogenase family protein [Clostridium homopropionicum]KOA19700.1 lactaldehyde reductase [Clostridium homopropionicum DSM 5847]SFF79664.1 alcohol dehydrogenase [Clostridium homopropionicum]